VTFGSVDRDNTIPQHRKPENQLISGISSSSSRYLKLFGAAFRGKRIEKITPTNPDQPCRTW
jgi:hypothetical protein